MERLELIVVQLEEAKRLIQVDRVPQLRLAFILLDNAVEVALHRTVEHLVLAHDLSGVRLDRMRKIEASVQNPSEYLKVKIRELESEVLSKRSLKQIGHDFNRKIDFLVERGMLDNSLGPVLKKLHRYRNDTYHRDKLRQDVLQPAALIYFDVACTILEIHSPSLYFLVDPAGTALDRFVAPRGIAPCDIVVDELKATIAGQLRDELALSLHAVRDALMAHLRARLDDLDRDFQSIEEMLSAPGMLPGDGLLLAQAELKGEVSLIDIRSRKYTYTQGDLEGWRIGLQSIEAIDDKYSMFTKYAAIEDAFEPLEDIVGLAMSAIEYELEQPAPFALWRVSDHHQ